MFGRSVLLIGLLGTASVQAQVSATFSSFPLTMQFFAREANDSAAMQVQGVVSTAGVDSVLCLVTRSGYGWARYRQKLVYQQGKAAFSFNPFIVAGLVEYGVKVYAYKKNIAYLLRQADKLVAGDVFLVNGQSNSHLPTYQAKYQNTYCRSFGSKPDFWNTSPYKASDTFWYLASGSGSTYQGAVSSWAIRLMQRLKDECRVPVCIISGGSGGGTIEYNMPWAAPNRMHLASPYGKLLYRATKAGLASKAKAMIWHQGESNTYSTYTSYAANFDTLYRAWKQDFPGLKKVYVFQIHHSSCGGTYQQQLREVQRSFAISYPDVELLSSCGLRGHDGCHYTFDGYNHMADVLLPLIKTQFYGSTDTLGIHPPQLVRAWCRPGSTQLHLVFGGNAAMVWPADTLAAAMKDYIAVDDAWKHITAWQTVGKEVLLTLDSAMNPGTVSYLPNTEYHDTPEVYQGPYLRNSRGVGALSFYRFPVDTIPPPLPAFSADKNTLCKADSVHFFNKSLYHTQVRWQFSGGQPATSTAENPVVFYALPGNWPVKLVVSNVLGADSMELQVYVTVNKPPAAFAGNDTAVCPGDSVQLMASGGLHYLWNPANGLNHAGRPDPVCIPAKTTTYLLTVADANGCQATDTLTVTVKSIVPVYAGPDVSLCTHSQPLVLQGSPAGGTWTGIPLSDSVFEPAVAGVGAFRLVYAAPQQCRLTDSLLVNVFPKPQLTLLADSEVCEGEPMQLAAATKHGKFVAWQGAGVFTSYSDTQTTYVPTKAENTDGKATLKAWATTQAAACPAVQASVVVRITPLPAPLISVVSDSLTALSGFHSYQWFHNNLPLPGQKQNWIKPEKPGIYTLLVSQKGCFGLSDSVAVVWQAVPNACVSAFSIYPNPGQGVFWVRPLPDIVNLELFDACGRSVPFLQINTGGVRQVEIQASPGCYWLKVQTPEGTRMLSYLLLHNLQNR